MDVDSLSVLHSADLQDCRELAAVPAAEIAARFVAILRKAGATVVQEVSYVYPNGGVTCVAVLAESHAVLHTWPETGCVNIDIFSCSPRLRIVAVVDEIAGFFGASRVSSHVVPRVTGLTEPIGTPDQQ